MNAAFALLTLLALWALVDFWLGIVTLRRARRDARAAAAFHRAGLRRW